MARHRNVRGMNYDDEFDSYYDVYGHSVEDDYGVSPSTEAEFLYDREKQHSMSAYLSPSVVPEEEEEDVNEEHATDKTASASLKPSEEEQLYECLEKMRNVVGDTVQETDLIKAALDNRCDPELALNSILSSSDPNAPKPQRRKQDRRRTANKETNFESIGVNNTVDSEITNYGVRPKAKVDLLSETAGQRSRESKSPSSDGDSAVEKVQSKTLEVPVDDSDRPRSGKSSKTSTPAASPLSQRKLNANRSGRSTPVQDGVQGEDAAVVRTPKSKSSEKDIMKEYNKERGSSKPLLNLVIIGHVDAGKSTLMGHLLYRLGCVMKKQMHKYEQDSKKLGKASFMYAWVLDETLEERNRGITMDVAHAKFETPNRTITLLDAPGHKDFIPNMITGAAQADVAILVVDATRGEFETGFEAGGQTREHTLLIRSLGVSQIAVAVNKLDNVEWCQERYNEITTRLKAFLRQAGYKDSDVTFVPCSGLTGENLIEKPKDSAFAAWYSGPCLVDVIDSFRPPERPVMKPFRLCVGDLFKGVGSGVCVSGRIEAGYISNGDRMVLMPAGEQGSVKGISLDEQSVTQAFAGDHVTLTISGIDMNKVMSGSVLSDVQNPIKVATRFQARVVIFSIELPITKGFPVILHYQSMSEQAVISKLISQLHKGTGEVVKNKPRCLTKNSSGIIEVKVSRPICVELYKEFKELGRITLRSGGTTIAAGVITSIIS